MGRVEGEDGGRREMLPVWQLLLSPTRMPPLPCIGALVRLSLRQVGVSQAITEAHIAASGTDAVKNQLKLVTEAAVGCRPRLVRFIE